MLQSAFRRLTALGVAGVFASPAVMSLVLCLCVPGATPHGGCDAAPGTGTSVSCCCENANAAEPATPIPSTAVVGAQTPLAALPALAVNTSSAGIGAAASLFTGSPVARSRPLFKHFSAFLI